MPPAAALRDSVKLALGNRYSEREFRQVLDLNVRPMYEERGYLRVEFPAIRLTPADPGPYNTLGQVLRLKGDEAGSRAAFAATCVCNVRFGVMSPNHPAPSWIMRHWKFCVPAPSGARNVKLNDGARPTVGRGKRLVAARTDKAIEARLTIAQNGRRCVAGAGADSNLEPMTVSRGN